jgi:hypothetical protein
MDLATFRGLLDQHGPDLERWPAAAADAAVALMAASPEAQDLFVAAVAAQAPGAEPDPQPLVGRVMSTIRKR